MNYYQDKLMGLLRKTSEKAVEAAKNFDADQFVNDADRILGGVIDKTGELADTRPKISRSRTCRTPAGPPWKK